MIKYARLLAIQLCPKLQAIKHLFFRFVYLPVTQNIEHRVMHIKKHGLTDTP